MRQIAWGRFWPWGLLVLLLGALTVLTWGRWGDRGESAAADSAEALADIVATIPPLDQQVPDNLETATFSLG